MTDDTNTDEEQPEIEAIDSLRSTLEFAKETEGSDRANALRAALGDVAAMDPEEQPHLPTLRETVRWAVSAPDEEVPYYVNRALEEVDAMEEGKKRVENERAGTEPDAGSIGEQLRTATTAHQALSDLRDLGLDEDAESSLLNAQEALDQIILQLAVEYGTVDA